MKTSENNNPNTGDVKTNQPNNPSNTNQNKPVPNPSQQPEPQHDPMRKQPHVDPDPTAPSPDEKRVDPYANAKQPERPANSNDLKEQKDRELNPTGKTRDTSVNDTTHKPGNPSSDLNQDKNPVDRNTEK